MIEFRSKKLNLGKHSVVPVAFEFTGVSKFDVDVTVTSRTSCGCTVANHQDTLKPGEIFKLTGTFTRSSKGEFHKTITVSCKADGPEYSQILEIFVTLI